MPENDRVLKPVGRELPGLGQRRFGELGGSVDMDKVSLHYADDFAGSGIGRYQRIQCFWLATQRDDEPPPRLAHFSRQDKQLFFRGFVLRGGSSSANREKKKRDEETKENPAVEGSCFSVFHARLPGLLLSILYGSSRSCNELANPKYPRKNGTIASAGKYIHQ